MFRRREARCCFLVAFVVVVLISTVALSTDYLDPHLANLSLPKVNVPQWLKPGKQGENHIPNTKTPSAPEASSDAAPTATPSSSGGGLSGENDSRLKQTLLAQKPHVPGYTVLDNLYLRNGTFFVLTSEEAEFPPTADIMARRPLEQNEKRSTFRVADINQDLQFLDPVTALLGQHATRISGISVVVLDSPSQVPNTFYSWWTEVVLGAWRVSANASALSDDSEQYSEISTRLPSRFILPNADPGSWDSSIKLNGPIMRGGLPNTAVETSEYWQDLRALDSTVVFDRVVLISRETAISRQTQDTGTSSVSSSRGGGLDLLEPSWDHVRKAIVHNLLGYLPGTPDNVTAQISQSTTQDRKPVVALFATTATQRKQGSGSPEAKNYVLDADSRQRLVGALRALEDGGVCEVHILDPERDGVRAQIELAARSTILLGAHAEALTNQLWMPRSPLSAVIELMRPQMFLPEYEVLARTLGHQHWTVWEDTLVTSNEAFERMNGTKTEDCDEVPLRVDAQVVMQFIKAHLGRLQEDSIASADAGNTSDDIEAAKSQEGTSPADLEVEILG